MIPAPSNDHCSCCEVIGEDPACQLHGLGTTWRKENPDICPECSGHGCECCNGSGFVADSDEQAPEFPMTPTQDRDARRGHDTGDFIDLIWARATKQPNPKEARVSESARER